MSILPSRVASPAYVYLTRTLPLLTGCPLQADPATPSLSAVVAASVVRPLIVLASVLTIPLPFHVPPLRPDWINPCTPVYAVPFHDPSEPFCSTRLFLCRSSLPGAVMLSVPMLLVAAGVPLAATVTTPLVVSALSRMTDAVTAAPVCTSVLPG